MNTTSRRSLLGLLMAVVMTTPGGPVSAAEASPVAKSAELHALFDAR